MKCKKCNCEEFIYFECTPPTTRKEKIIGIISSIILVIIIVICIIINKPLSYMGILIAILSYKMIIDGLSIVIINRNAEYKIKAMCKGCEDIHYIKEKELYNAKKEG